MHSRSGSAAGAAPSTALLAGSPTTSSPSVSVLDWDEGLVNGFVIDVLKMEQYEEQIYEHGITGDVLIAMDHDALSDMGMSSLGHRLKLLRAVWEVKREQGIEIGDEDWKPADVPQDGPKREVERLNDAIQELQERLQNLERDHVRMLNTLEEQGIAIPMATSADGDLMHEISPGRRNGAGPGGQWREYGDGQESGPSKLTRRASHVFPSSLASSTASIPQPLKSSDSAGFGDASTPTSSSALHAPRTFDSPSQTAPYDKTRTVQASSSRIPAIAPPPFTRMISGGSLANAAAGSPPPTGAATLPQNSHTPIKSGLGASSSAPPGSLLPSPANLPSSNAGASTSNPSQAGNTGAASDNATAKARAAKESANQAARSFRVTLEDPCWKVLPAALKKYKINDDWKQYALFICFGNTERCLSYDEKPLLLFQKLKESGQKPVFMLRHIREIKSPISVAQAKQAMKLGLAPNSTINVLPKIRPSSDTSTSPTKPVGSAGVSAGGLQPARRPEDAFPELPSPGPGEGGNKFQQQQSQQQQSGTLVDKDGNVQNVTYAVAIYPYIADRQDEFDVGVGAVFVILSKSSGWYIVQKDPDGLGQIIPDNTKSGWVPAGCLLELSSPISRVSPAVTPGEPLPTYPGLAPLPPIAIISTSYPGVVLMDYKKKASDEMDVKEGQSVRVYKKYSHWSYAIRADTGERGWVPAWFIGKLETGSESNPSTATLTAGPRSAGPLPSANSTSTNGTSGSSTEGSGRTAYHPGATSSGGREEDGEEIGFDDGGAGVAALKGYL